MVYVNDLSFVPDRFKQRAQRVDLSDVSLNFELAADLERETQALLNDLLKSDACLKKRQAADRGWAMTLWEEYGILLLFGLLIVVLLAFSPAIMRRVDPPQWGRFLMLAIPAICVIAVLSFSLVRTSAMVAQTRSEADPCRPERYLFPAATPELRNKKMTMIEQLKKTVQGMHTMRDHQLKTTVEGKGP